MKGKKIFAITLVVIMLVNVLFSSFSAVFAANNETYTFNNKLYKAVKKALKAKPEITSAVYNDVNLSVSLSSDDLAKITELKLANSGIQDLTGLDAFQSVERLELSQNDLSEESNLNVLNLMPKLNYLDISSNHIASIVDIKDLADRLISTDSLIIGGQKCNVVQEYERMTGAGADSEVTHEFELPQILSYLGFSKAEWKSIYINYERPNSTPEIIKYDNDALNLEKDVPEIYNNDHLSINTEGTSITQNGHIVLNVGKRERDSEGFISVTEYDGLLKLTLEIVDGNPEVSQNNNLNLAPENLLYDSVFNLCFVVHSDYTDVISIKDDNLYRALKIQLTAGQTKNKELSTYKYSVDETGEVEYANYSYEVIPGSKYVKLKYVRSVDGLYTYFYNPNNGNLYLYPYLLEDYAGTSYKVVKEGNTPKYFYKPDSEIGKIGKVYRYRDTATDDASIESISEQYVIDDLIGRLTKVSRNVEAVVVENDNNGLITQVRQYRMPMEKVCITDEYTGPNSNKFFSTMSLTEDTALNGSFSSTYSIMSRDNKQIFGKFGGTSIGGIDYVDISTNSYLYVPSIFAYNGSVDDAIESLEPKKIATNLYKAAYDDAKTFVINDVVLMNDIQTLILNNKEIRDLSGIEGFFGLKNKLNVSHNYLENIDEIEEIVAAKNARSESLLSKYSGLLKNGDEYFSANGEKYNSLQSAYDANVGFKSEFSSLNDSIKADTTSLRDAFIQYALTEQGRPNDGETQADADVRVSNAALAQLSEAFNNVNKKWTNTEEGAESYSEKILELNGKVTGATSAMYYFLDSLYYYYKDEYKLTSLLSPSINYQDILEYEIYDEIAGEDANIVESEIRPLIEEEYSFLKTLEASNALSMLDKELLKEFFGVDYNSKAEGAAAPLAYVLDKDLEGISANQCYNRLDTIKKIALYSEMANYCLIKRISDDDSKCYDLEYLYKKIDELDTNQIPHEYEDRVLEAFIAGNSNPLETTKDRKAFEIYKAYTDRIYEFKDASNNDSSVTACGDAFGNGTDSAYKEFVRFNFVNGAFDKDALIAEIDSKRVDGKTYIIDDTTISSKIDDFFVNSNMKTSLIMADQIEGGYNNTRTIGSNLTYDNRDISLETDNREESDRLFLYDQLMSLAGKLLNGDIGRYVKMPDLVELDISYNAELSDISNITKMPKLAKLNAAYDYIADVDNIDWEAMTSLRSLNLNYNFIRDITPVLKLKKLRELYLSNNLIENLPITADGYKETFKYMEDLDLSGNRLKDIEPMLQYLDFIRAGNYGDYLATHEDAVKINLNNQKIEITIAEPILLSEHEFTFDYELPKIFSQLEAIDIERTAFGTSSDFGRIESEGRYVTLPTYTPGTKTGIVTVIPMSGDGTEVTDCIGNGTTATIHYTVVGTAPNPNPNPGPDDGGDTQKTVTYSPTTNVSVKKGSSLQFNATVDGTVNNTVPEWDVEDETSADTKIVNGLLTVGEDEEAETIHVKATEKHTTPEGKTTTIDVKVLAADSEEEPTKTVVYNPTGTITMDKGSTKQIDATVDGTIDNTVPTWSMSGNKSANSKVENGLVTIGEDETAETITVTATESYSTGEPITTTFTIKVNGNEKPDDPEEPTKKVTAIVVSPESANVRVGNSQTFTVSVEGENLEADDKKLTATFTGKMSENTSLSEVDGKLVLRVAEDETANELTIVLKSKFDESVTKTVKIKVLKSGTDDNPEADIELGYNIVDGTNLTNIAPKTPIADFKANLLNGNNGYKVVIRKDGSIVEPEYMASGLTVEIQDKDGNTVKDKNGNLYVYDSVVYGDCNGDGVADSLDSKIIKAYKNETENLSEPYKRAADLDGNGIINLKDARLLLYHRAEVSGFVLNYTK